MQNRPKGLLFLVCCASVLWTEPGFGDEAPFSLSPELTIASGVANANSDTLNPGPSAISFDGTRFLVVFCSDIASPSGFYGTFVSLSGDVSLPVFIASSTCPSEPSAAFDGNNYLVVFSRGGEIFGARVTPAGGVLDGADGFPISSDVPFNGTCFSPEVAFDGTGFLVVWNEFLDNHDIIGARVTPGGSALGEFPVFQAQGEQVFPSLAFGSGAYLVAWRDTRSGSGPSPDTDVYATRVTPEGLVLEPDGIPISRAQGVQGAPDVTFDSVNFFVTWVDGRKDVDASQPAFDIYGTRLTPDGLLLDGPSKTGGIRINASPFSKGRPNVGFDGLKYFVVWRVGAFPNHRPAGIAVARLAATGALIDGPDTAGILISEPVCDTCRLVFPALHFGGEKFLLVWPNNIELSGATKDIVGVLLTPRTGICNVDLRYEGDTLTMGFELGSLSLARWNVWLSVGNVTLRLWSVPRPRIVPLVTFDFPIPGFPPSGTIGFLSTLATADGIVCSDWQVVHTGQPSIRPTAEEIRLRIRSEITFRDFFP